MIMKKIISEFIQRGLIACGFGPIVLAVLYLILAYNGVLESLTVKQVCTGIFSLSLLAFVAGGINVLYQIERLPLMIGVLIHGFVLYIGYLGTYLVNGWLLWSKIPIIVFSIIFVVGYLLIWAIIYAVTKNKAKKINEILEKNNKN